jgi:hypothetical protein
MSTFLASDWVVLVPDCSCTCFRSGETYAVDTVLLPGSDPDGDALTDERDRVRLRVPQRNEPEDSVDATLPLKSTVIGQHGVRWHRVTFLLDRDAEHVASLSGGRDSARVGFKNEELTGTLRCQDLGHARLIARCNHSIANHGTQESRRNLVDGP